jgi:hypothetical protein
MRVWPVAASGPSSCVNDQVNPRNGPRQVGPLLRERSVPRCERLSVRGRFSAARANEIVVIVRIRADRRKEKNDDDAMRLLGDGERNLPAVKACRSKSGTTFPMSSARTGVGTVRVKTRSRPTAPADLPARLTILTAGLASPGPKSAARTGGGPPVSARNPS